MMLDPKLIKSTIGVSMLRPKKKPPTCTSPKSYNEFNMSQPRDDMSLPLQVYFPPPPPLGYTFLQLGRKRVLSEGGTTRWQAIKERTHKMVLAYTFGAPPVGQPSLSNVLHTCGTVGCHQPHHLLYGSVEDNNLTGLAAIRRYKELALEQHREYFGLGEP